MRGEKNPQHREREWNLRMTRATKEWEKPRDFQKKRLFFLRHTSKTEAHAPPQHQTRRVLWKKQRPRNKAIYSSRLSKSLLEDTVFWLTPLFQEVSWHQNKQLLTQRLSLLFSEWRRWEKRATLVHEWRRTFQTTQIMPYIKDDILLLK